MFRKKSVTEKMKNVINDYESGEIRDFNKKYHDINKLIEKFISETGGILYGGLALNLILPPSKQFYSKDNAKPDYDYLSVNPKNDAIKLCNLIYNKTKSKDLMVKDAMHEGTYKIFLDGHGFVDITQISSHLYNRYKELKLEKAGKKLSLVPQAFIKYSLHNEMCKPLSSLGRWEKIYERLKLFYSENLISQDSLIRKIEKINFKKYINNCNDPKVIKLLEFLLADNYFNKFPIIGIYGFLKYFKNVNNKYEELFKTLNKKLTKFNILNDENEEAYLSIISSEGSKTANTLAQNLKNYIKNSSSLKNDNFTVFVHEQIVSDRKRYIIVLNTNKKFVNLLSVYETETCLTTKKMGTHIIGSVDTLISMQYLAILYYYSTSNNKLYYLFCEILNFLIMKNDSNINRKFSIKCYGKELTLSQLKAQSLKKKKFKYVPSEKKNIK
jgi:hypothetical protein